MSNSGVKLPVVGFHFNFFNGSPGMHSLSLLPAAMEYLSSTTTAAEEHGDLFERSGLGIRGSRTASLLVRDGACR